jgi:hypothetical protein
MAEQQQQSPEAEHTIRFEGYFYLLSDVHFHRPSEHWARWPSNWSWLRVIRPETREANRISSTVAFSRDEHQMLSA